MPLDRDFMWHRGIGQSHNIFSTSCRSSQCVPSASVVPITIHPRAKQITSPCTAAADAGPGLITGAGSGAEGSVTGGGAKAAAADLGDVFSSAPPVFIAWSDALHKGTAVVFPVGAGTGMVVVVMGIGVVHMMGDAGLAEVTVSDVDETAAGVTVSFVYVTAAGEDDIRG